MAATILPPVGLSLTTGLVLMLELLKTDRRALVGS
mgnify:FL=1